MISQSRILELAYAQACKEWDIALDLASKGDKQAMKREEELHKEINEILKLIILELMREEREE